MQVRQNKNGRFFIDRYDEGGRRIRRVIREARTRTQAEKAAQKFWDELYARKFEPKQKHVLVTDFVETKFFVYSKDHKRSFYDDQKICEQFCKEFKGVYLGEVTKDMLRNYQRKRRDEPKRDGGKRSPARVNREFNTISKIFSLAVEEGLIQENLCRKVKRLREGKMPIRELSCDEEARLLEALTPYPRTKAIVIVSLYTGMRKGEVFDLRWRDIDREQNRLYIPNKKTERERYIPIARQVNEILDVMEQAPKGEFVFPRLKQGLPKSQLPGKNANPLNIDRSFKKALKEAGISNFRFHDLRHSAGTRLSELGVPLPTIAAIFGHLRIETTRRYAHATDKGVKDAIAKLSQYVTSS